MIASLAAGTRSFQLWITFPANEGRLNADGISNDVVTTLAAAPSARGSSSGEAFSCDAESSPGSGYDT